MTRPTPTQVIHEMVDAGELAPAARDMDPRDVLHQYVNVNALDPAETRAVYARVGVPLPLPVEDLLEGDTVDLEPLLIAWGAHDEHYDADLFVAQCERATVESVTTAHDGSIVISTDQMNLAVPAGTIVEI